MKQILTPNKLAGLLNFLYKYENSDENHWGFNSEEFQLILLVFKSKSL